MRRRVVKYMNVVGDEMVWKVISYFMCRRISRIGLVGVNHNHNIYCRREISGEWIFNGAINIFLFDEFLKHTNTWNQRLGFIDRERISLLCKSTHENSTCRWIRNILRKIIDRNWHLNVYWKMSKPIRNTQVHSIA